MSRNRLPFEVKVAKPCTESWTAMQGSQRERHCQSCDKQVHNFAAMTSREIAELVAKTGGKLCARITQSVDGSLITLDSRPRTSIAAQIAVSATLAIGAAGCAAQSTVEPLDSQAVLNGKVLNPDGSGPLGDAIITLRTDGMVRAETRSNAAGEFEVFVRPGRYDVEIRKDLASIQFHSVSLEEGQQSIPPTSPASTVTVTAESFVIMGDIGVFQTHFSFAYILRHPIQYGKYLAHKL